MAGRSTSLGAVYITLERLEEKGYVSSGVGDPTPERGGRAKKILPGGGYRPNGVKALRQYNHKALQWPWPAPRRHEMRRQKLASLFITHPDDDHTSLPRIPHHGSLLKASAVGPSVLSYFDESGVSPFTPPRSAEYLLLCLLPRKNREYFMGCLEEEFRTVLLPKYGEFWARVYYWSQAIQSLASVGWGLIKKLASLAAIWRVLR
jgi:hypothetical protein